MSDDGDSSDREVGACVCQRAVYFLANSIYVNARTQNATLDMIFLQAVLGKR